jgi:peptide chain release factor subunit 1
MMSTTSVSWERLRDLAGFRADHGCAISLYLNLDPHLTPTAADLAARANSLLDEAARRAEAARSDLTHAQRVALREDVDRLQRFVQLEFDRDGAQGLAVFAGQLDGLWQPLVLAQTVPDAVRVGKELFLTPLVPLVGRGDGTLVAAVGRERGEVYRLQGGRLEEVADRTEEQPGRHDQGGWSQARYRRHIESLVHGHLREVASELEHRVRSGGYELVIVSSEETRAELADLLAPEVRAALIGWTQGQAHASPRDLLELALPLVERRRQERERETVERWRQEVGRNGRAAAGWKETLNAASDARVELLLYRQGVERAALCCPACGRLSVEDGRCPLDGAELELRDEGLDLAIHQTLAHGGTVCVTLGGQDLETAEGIGALLRY